MAQAKGGGGGGIGQRGIGCGTGVIGCCTTVVVVTADIVLDLDTNPQAKRIPPTIANMMPPIRRNQTYQG